MVAVPNPTTAAAGAKILASTWNADVRDADTYVVENLGGLGSRNVLFNSHFDVWQRGTSFSLTSSAVAQYTADRWCSRRSGTTGATVSRQTGPSGQTYSMRVQRDSANANTTAIETYQALTTLNSVRLAGRTCQLLLTLKAGVDFSATSSLVTVKVVTGTGTDQAAATAWTGTADALSTTQAITTTSTTYTFDAISIPSNATQIKVYVAYTPTGTAGANDWIEIEAAQLTAGKATGFERLLYEDTLRRCQAYYYQWGPFGGSRYTSVGWCYSSTVLYAIFKFPVSMRTSPAVWFSAANDFTATTSSAAYNSTNVTGSHVTPDQCLITCTVASGLTAGQAAMFSNDQDTTNAAIYATAEL